ncbi:hypothetical protein [Kordiimonas marina]|uniref:hypothetical protein n=1 Tax=Kordiimonas marina TaxID=2872312 RepID=UPI001FF17B48|nr:hypothetical protein [Kordiimonas marina]MCJ9428477.1 hypothetical protein [Kordiimonas marina]
MNVGKFILNVVVAYVLFAVLYTAVEMWVLADQVAAMKPLMKDPAETTISYAYYLVQTIVFVWLFGKVAGGRTLMDGVTFGIMLALYASASSATMMVALKGFPEGQILPWTIANIVVFAVIAAVLSLLDAKGWGVMATASDGDEGD